MTLLHIFYLHEQFTSVKNILPLSMTFCGWVEERIWVKPNMIYFAQRWFLKLDKYLIFLIFLLQDYHLVPWIHVRPIYWVIILMENEGVIIWTEACNSEIWQGFIELSLLRKWTTYYIRSYQTSDILIILPYIFMGKWFPTAFLYTPIYFACSFLQQSPSVAFTSIRSRKPPWAARIHLKPKWAIAAITKGYQKNRNSNM